MAEMLEVKNLVAKYGDFQALFGIDFAMAQGGIVALIGANGAGKSTFLKAIAGQMANKQGEIRFEDREIGLLSSDEIVATGIAMVPEGRRLFRSLTVEENLKVGAFSGRTGRWTLDTVYALFPVLKERRQSAATALSGGQQQMVAIGRALMSNPRLLLCDEVSLGLCASRHQRHLRHLPHAARRRPFHRGRRAGHRYGDTSGRRHLLLHARPGDLARFAERARQGSDLRRLFRARGARA